MVSSDNLLCYSDWTITFTINTVSSDKQVVTAISHNNKLIAIFSKRLTKPQRNHNTTEKEHLAMVE